MSIAAVWFKRDLRLEDHQPLCRAIASGRPALLLYCFEDSLVEDPRHSTRHWRFVTESLRDMNVTPGTYGGRIHVFRGEILDLLPSLHRQFHIRELFSHEETGVGITFERGRRVAEFVRQNGISWRESASDGVERRQYALPGVDGLRQLSLPGDAGEFLLSSPLATLARRC